MRIVAGTFRGRHLNSPRGASIRPTTDRVREAIFSIIASRLCDAHVLDLFAGTGALGLEALSRGAARAVFVDQSPEAVRLIRANIELCGAGDRAEVIHASVKQAIRRLGLKGDAFHLIFMDPPYGQGFLEENLPLLGGVARCGVLVVAEHDKKDVLSDRLEQWLKIEERRYGDTSISFFERETPC